MDEIDREILMGLQYRIRASERPFDELADDLDIEASELIERARRMKEDGLIIRFGAQINYRVFSERFAALVGARVEGDNVESVERVARMINAERGVKHNYLRDHPRYRIWFTLKASSRDELYSKIEDLMRRAGIDDYVILPSKRVWKLDVRYDLLEGISSSPPIPEPEVLPSPEELGVEENLLRALSNLEISERPLLGISERFGYGEDELASLIDELTRKRVARYFGAVLSSERIGFRENGMVVLGIDQDKASELAERIVRSYPQVTHCVERISDPERWPYPLYFMLHSRSRDRIIALAKEIGDRFGIDRIDVLFSISNLRKLE